MVDLIITGIGGQGTVSLGHLICEVLNELEIAFVAAETHGMSQRGGSVIFHLRIGTTKISPIIEKQQADIILSGEPMEALRAIEYLRPDGIVLTEVEGILSPVATQMGFDYPDTDELFSRIESYTQNLIKLPAVEIANEIGNSRIANIVLLGRLFAMDLLPINYDQMSQHIIDKWPKFAEFNLKALKLGFQNEMNSPKITQQ